MACERIDLDAVEESRDIVHRAVACLVQGGVVALPTESGLLPVANALSSTAVAELLRVAPLIPNARPSLLISSAEALRDWVPSIGARVRKLARRAWPGPLGLIFPESSVGALSARLPLTSLQAWRHESTYRFRSPGHPFVRDVLSLLPGPILTMGEFSKSAGQNVAGVSMIVESSRGRRQGPTTAVLVEVDQWRIVEPGAITEKEVASMSGTTILFVCTGNTCRSPMAEALCKVLLAKRLGCEPDDLIARGYVVLSAGVGAMNGMPAASHAIDVVKEHGGSLDEHASRKVSADLLKGADLVLAMTSDHLDTLRELSGEAAERTILLDPDGDDVPDPYGSDLESYRRTASALERFLEQLLDSREFH